MESTLDMARSLQRAVDSELVSAQASLVALATSPAFVSGDLAGVHRQATDVLAAHPGSDIIVADITGQQVMNSFLPYGAALPKRKNPDGVRRVFEEGKPMVSDLFYGAVTGKALVDINVPVFDEKRVLYDLAMTIPAAQLASVFAPQHLPTEWVVAIIDSKGVVVARTQASAQFVGHQVRPRLQQAIEEAAEGNFKDTTLEGIPVVTVYSRSPATGWTVAIGVPITIFSRNSSDGYGGRWAARSFRYSPPSRWR